MKNKKVTIIVPVYKDWTSLEKCILSLIRFVDARHNVIFINDNGPEADELEKRIKNYLEGNSNFFYYRNEKNLGFVQTCNKGVFFLDHTDNDILLLNSDTETTEGFLEEMLEVLYASEKHGVVCPRSNNATILSIPFFYNGDRDSIINKSYEYFQVVSPKLPRYTVIPTGVGFCFLIKRNIINNFGLFDEIYGRGYNEENDFCCRINRYGYSTVMANRAFVFHFEGKSFTKKERDSQNIINSEILNRRFPEYQNSVNKYFSKNINPIDYFSDFICNAYKKKKILFSLYNLPDVYNGTAEYGLSLLSNYFKNFKDKYDIYILTNDRGRSFHKLDLLYKNIISPAELNSSNSRFDLTIFPSQFFDMEQLILLNKHSLRIIFSLQDIIAWRCNYLNNDNKDYILKYSLKYADGIIAISDFTRRDTEKYLGSDFIDTYYIKNYKIIYHGISNKNDIISKSNQKFILIVGNSFSHKSVAEALKAISLIKKDIIVLGLSRDDLLKKGVIINKNTKCYKSGLLEDSLVESLYAKCSIVVFPSQYEGFGLPVIKSISYGKKVVLFNNELNNELLDNNKSLRDNSFMFNNFNDLPATCFKALNSGFVDVDKKRRTWEDVSVDTEKFVSEILNKQIDVEKIRERWDFFNYLESLKQEKNNLVAGTPSKKYRLDELLTKGVKILRKKGLKMFLAYTIKYLKYGENYFKTNGS